MHDQRAVCSIDRATDGREHLQALVLAEQIRAREISDRHALDELECDIGKAFRGEPGLDHPRDIRVLQANQRTLLASEAAPGFRAQNVLTQELQCDALPRAFELAVRLEHRRGASFADHSHDFERADTAAWRRRRRRGIANRTREILETRARYWLVFRGVCAQQRLDPCPHGRFRGLRVEKPGTRGRRKRERRLEQFAQVLRRCLHMSG